MQLILLADDTGLSYKRILLIVNALIEKGVAPLSIIYITRNLAFKPHDLVRISL